MKKTTFRLSHYILTILLVLVTGLSFGQKKQYLKTHSKTELLKDFDLLISSLKEAHTGLYWYTNRQKFDSVCRVHRNKIYEGMNSLEFYRVVSAITASTKEGHCGARRSRDIREYIIRKMNFLPFYVKVINKNIYVLNNYNGVNTKGKIITKINGVPTYSIINKLFNHTSADGFIKSGMYKHLDFRAFAYNYAWYFKQKKLYTVQFKDPKSNKTDNVSIIPIDFVTLNRMGKSFPRRNYKKPAKLNIDIKTNIGVLTFNTFSEHYYKKAGIVFKDFVDKSFRTLDQQMIKNLIIDLRNNGGGSEGYEDYVFAYLTNKPYKKYNYVQASAFKYSFIKYTTYAKDTTAYRGFKDMLKDEHYLAMDGRVLRKNNVLPPEPIKNKNSFKGNIYVLISGYTYSGGSELASLLKGHTNAIFIGEETGGGFYGQTSGSYIYLMLPNSQIGVRIPILKFSVAVKSNEIPFGRGVLPDYHIEQTFEDYIEKKDTQLNFTFKLINKKE